MQVQVTSGNQTKLQAVAEVLGPNYEIVSQPSLVETRNQPVGLEQTFATGIERMEGIDANMIVSVESGLVNIESLLQNEVHDVATVTIRTPNGDFKGSHELVVQLPESYNGPELLQVLVLELANNGRTFGQIIANDEILPGTWMESFQDVSRKQQIMFAVQEAWDKFQASLVDPHAVLWNSVVCYPDFPKPGVLFQDIFPMVRDQLPVLGNQVRELCSGREFDYVAGLESRGFIVGMIVAMVCGKKFVPVRKANKLPGEKYEVNYGTEYSQDIFQMAVGSMEPGKRVMLADDLLATGGSMKGAAELVEQAGAVVDSCFVLTLVPGLLDRAREKLNGYEIIPLLTPQD